MDWNQVALQMGFAGLEPEPQTLDLVLKFILFLIQRYSATVVDSLYDLSGLVVGREECISISCHLF